MTKQEFIEKYKNNLITLPYSPNNYFDSSQDFLCLSSVHLDKDKKEKLVEICTFMSKNDYILRVPNLKIAYIPNNIININFCFIEQRSISEEEFSQYYNKAKVFSIEEIFNDYESFLKEEEKVDNIYYNKAINFLRDITICSKDNFSLKKIVKNQNGKYSDGNLIYIRELETYCEKIVYHNGIVFWNIEKPEEEIVYLRKEKVFVHLIRKDINKGEHFSVFEFIDKNGLNEQIAMDLGCSLALKAKEEDEEGFEKLFKEIKEAVEKYKIQYNIPSSCTNNFMEVVNTYSLK